MELRAIGLEFKKLANPQKAKTLAGFFKTGKGEYGEGDIFLGITVPQTRGIVKKYADKINLPETEKLLRSKFHEERLAALLILVEKYKKGSAAEKEKIFRFYLKNTKYINNWDLVDLSSRDVVGAFLDGKPKNILYKLARSKNLWERRIAIVSTYHYIKRKKCGETFKISEILLNDKHDLIHKAVGWMLREAGKNCSEKILEDFLKSRYKNMPRTMLRYAIEKFPENKRKKYLSGKI